MTRLPWSVHNYHYLTAYVAYIVARLQLQLPEPSDSLPARPDLRDFAGYPPPALLRLTALFNLSQFEQEILVLCAAAELERLLGSLCADLNGSQQQTFPTFRVAMASLEQVDWQALLPSAPLRHWHLIQVAPGTELMQAQLCIDERILHELMGMPYLDERLRGVVSYTRPEEYIYLVAASHQALATKIATLLNQDLVNASQLNASQLNDSQPNYAQPNYLQLCGQDFQTLKQILMTACLKLNRPLLTIAAEALPTDLTQANLVQSLCEREAQLSEAVLLINCDRMEGESAQVAQQSAAVARFIDQCQGTIIVTQRERKAWGHRAALTFEVENLPPLEQQALWQLALAKSQLEAAAGDVDRLVSTFNLNAQTIQAVASQIKLVGSAKLEDLWQSCLEQSRPKFDGLAQQIHSQVGWADLVLPDKEIAVLRKIATHVRRRSTVYEQWGFGAKSRRGLGISALFAGASGTGKTLAAEVLANELNLDLHRIDISSVVSKYIGETEKNLRKIFDAAESGGAILLFDEADALFAKRSDVKDSHDRYANMEVAYLLQRIEAYRGLAILTTNLKDSLDQAFLRRIRFVVQFPFPDLTQRAEIWRRVFPAQTPVQTLSHHKLARLNVSGGNIRNIALNAAFLAADAEESVGMGHILQAAQAEYIKLERPLTDQEVRGWMTGESA